MYYSEIDLDELVTYVKMKNPNSNSINNFQIVQVFDFEPIKYENGINAEIDFDFEYRDTSLLDLRFEWIKNSNGILFYPTKRKPGALNGCNSREYL